MEQDHLVNMDQRMVEGTGLTSYNEAIPNVLDIIDALEIDVRGFDFANQWITALLGQRPTAFQIVPPKRTAPKVTHLFFNARNTERSKGYKNLAFGFPILTKKDGTFSKGFAALPIFLWNVQFEPSLHKTNHWFIHKTEPTNVVLNPLLKQLGPEVAELVAKYKAKVKKGLVNMDLCKSFCASIAEIFDFYNEPPKYSIEKFPEIVDLATIQQSGSIVWSGIFSAFPPVHFYSPTDKIISKDYWRQALPVKNQTKFQFCFLPADHQQKLVQVAASKNRFLLIEGPTGSGKKHTICNLIIGNLISGERTLIINKTLAGLEQIAQKMIKEGFGEFTYLFKNIELDKDNIVEGLVAKSKKGKSSNKNDRSEFLLSYQRFNKFRLQLEKTASGYAKSVFDINNWTQTVGLYLKNSRLEGKEFLDTQLQISDFNFDYIEYEQLREAIEKGENLFTELFAFYHPLDDIKDELFQKENKRVAKNELANKLNILQNKTRKIQRQYYQKVGLYKDDLEEYYEKYFIELSILIEEIQDIIDQLQVRFGNEYDATSVGNLNILKNFSGKSKSALTLKQQMLSSFSVLKSKYSAQPFFDFEFMEESNGNISLIGKELESFEQVLQNWRIRNQISIQDNIKNLNSKTVNINIKTGKKIGELEHNIEKFIAEINKSQLYKHAFLNNAMTLQLKQQLLDEVAEKLNQTIFNLRDFETFYDWRQLWTNFSKNEENVLKALIKVRPNNWIATFDAWYYHNLLTKQSRKSANFEPLLNTFLTNFDLLKAKAPNYLKDVWHNKQLDTVAQIKNNSRSYRKSLFEKSPNTIAFSSYFNTHLKNITNFYPVILMTEDMAKVVLAKQNQAIFENLIIQDGTNYTKEEGGSLLNLAKKVGVFGTSKDEGIGEPNSFWNTAKSLAGKHVVLKNQHRKEANSILTFNDAAFDQQFGTKLALPVNDSAVAIVAVNGAYSESFKTNELECKQMVSLLKDIKGTPQNTYPKVGFVCATLEQRNMFATYLLQIKQNKADEADKIKHLERNGMGVYSLQELNGQQFDIVIYSCTFSIVASSGEMTQHTDLLNTPHGRNMIQRLFTSGLKKIILCHSFSTEFIKKQLKKSTKDTWSIIANFIEFSMAIHQKDSLKANKVIENLSANIAKPKIEEKAVFLEEVATYLSAYFEPDRILSNHVINGKLYPLIIKGSTINKTNYIIQADSFFNKADTFSFVYQNQMNQFLKAEGYRSISIWSRDWWRQPEAEARKLASKIIRLDGDLVVSQVGNVG